MVTAVIFSKLLKRGAEYYPLIHLENFAKTKRRSMSDAMPRNSSFPAREDAGDRSYNTVEKS